MKIVVKYFSLPVILSLSSLFIFSIAYAQVTITTSSIDTTTCPGSSVKVGYKIFGIFLAGNIFTAQLSDTSGSFAIPVNIGDSTTVSDTIIISTIPSATLPGNKYRIRVISTNPIDTGTANVSNITVHASPQAIISAIGQTNFCQGGGVTLRSSAGKSYLWSTGDTTASIQDSISNSITVIITDSNGCVSPPSVVTNITVNPLPIATITQGSPTTFCQGEQVTLTASPGNSYLWSTGAITAAIIVTMSGRDSVKVTDGHGCISASSAAAIVIVNPNDDASFNYFSETICQSGPDPSPVITGTTGGTFTSSPAGLTIDGSTGKITLNGSALSTYNVTYTTSGTCPESSTVSITLTTAPNAGFTYAGSYSLGGTNPFPTFGTGASAGLFSAVPTGLIFINAGSGQIDLTNSTPGTYTITNTIAAEGGCTGSSASFGVIIYPATTANAGANANVCAGSSYTLSGSIGGQSTYDVWTTSGTGTFDNPNLETATYTPSAADIIAGSIVLTFSVTNVTGQPPWNPVASTMTLTVEICTGVSQTTQNNPAINTGNVFIYPNPCSGNFTIASSSPEKQLLRIRDLTGKIVFSQFIFTGITTIDSQSLDAGIYNLSITGNGESQNIRIVIVR